MMMMRVIFVLYAFVVLPSTCHDNTASIVVATTTDRTIFNDLETIRPEGTTPTAEKAIEMKDFVQAALDNFTTAGDYPEEVLSSRDVTGIGLVGNAAVAEERLVTTERIVESIISDDELNDYIYGDSLFADEETEEEIGTSTVQNAFTTTIVDYIYGKESSSINPSGVEDLPSFTTERILHINSPTSTDDDQIFTYTQDNNLDSTTIPPLDVKGGNPIVITSPPFPFEVEESIITIPSILMEQINSKKDFNLIDLDEEKHEDGLTRKETIDDLPNKEISFTSTETADDLDSSISSIDAERFEITTGKVFVTSEKLISTNTISIPKEQDLLKIATDAEKLETPFTNPIFTTDTIFTEAEMLEDFSKTSTILITTENPISTKTIPTPEDSTKIVTDPEQFEITTSESFAPFSTNPTLENPSTLHSSTNNEGEEQKEEKLVEESTTTTLDSISEMTENFDYTTTEDDYDETNLPNPQETTTTIIDIWLAERNATRNQFEEDPTNNEATTQYYETISSETDRETSTFSSNSALPESDFDDAITTESVSFRNQKELKNVQISPTTTLDEEEDERRKEAEEKIASTAASEENITSTIFSKELIDNGQFTADAINILKIDNYETTETSAFLNGDDGEDSNGDSTSSSLSSLSAVYEDEKNWKKEESDDELPSLGNTNFELNEVTALNVKSELDAEIETTTTEQSDNLQIEENPTEDRMESLEKQTISNDKNEETQTEGETLIGLAKTLGNEVESKFEFEERTTTIRSKEENLDQNIPPIVNENIEEKEEDSKENQSKMKSDHELLANGKEEIGEEEHIEELSENVTSNSINEESVTEIITNQESNEVNDDKNIPNDIDEEIEELEGHIVENEEELESIKEEIETTTKFDDDREEAIKNEQSNEENEDDSESIREGIEVTTKSDASREETIENEERNEDESKSSGEENETTTEFNDNREELIKTEDSNEDESETTGERIVTTTEKNEELKEDLAENKEETIANEDSNNDDELLSIGEEIETTTKSVDVREEAAKNEERDEEEISDELDDNPDESELTGEEIETTTKSVDVREEAAKNEERNEEISDELEENHDESELTEEEIETTTKFDDNREETIDNDDRSKDNDDVSETIGEEIETTTKFDDGREETAKNEERNEEISDELNENQDESELTEEEIESTTKFDDSKEETIKNEEESDEEHDDDSESIREENEVTTKFDDSREETIDNEESSKEDNDDVSETTGEEIETTTKFDDHRDETNEEINEELVKDLSGNEEKDKVNDNDSKTTGEENEATTKFDDGREETAKNEERNEEISDELEENHDETELTEEEIETTTKFDDSKEETIRNEEESDEEHEDESESISEEIETTTKFDDNRDETNEELEEDLSGNEEMIKNEENDNVSKTTGEENEATTKFDDSREESKEDDDVSETTGEEIETTTKFDDNRNETINNEESNEEISDELEENEDQSKSTGEEIEATTKFDDSSEERIKNDDDSESTREEIEATTGFDKNGEGTIKNEELEKEDLVENIGANKDIKGFKITEEETGKNEDISETNQENYNRTILKDENVANEENPKTQQNGNRDEGQFQQDDIKTTDSIITSMKELDELDNILNRTSTMSKTLDDPTTSTNSLEETEENEEDLDLITKINIPLSSLPEEQELFSKHVFKTYIDKITTEEALIEYIQTLSTPKNLVDMLRGEDSNGSHHLLTDRDTKQLNLSSLDVRDWQKISLNGLAEEDGDLDGGRGNDSSDSLIDVLPTHYYDEDYHSEEFNSSETSYSLYILTIPKNEDDDWCLYGNISLRILIGEHVIDLPQNSYVSFNSTAQRYDLAVSWKEEGVGKANNSVVIRLAFDERIYFVEFVEIIHVDEVEVTISSKDDLALLTTNIGDKMIGNTTIDFENGYQLELIDVNLRLRNISSNYEDPTSASRENAVISKTMLIAICASSSSCLLLLIIAVLLYRKFSSKATVYKMTIE